ncbi:hypothetical protein BKH46_05120 [Helicobacter sp. 12S02634-8]|nr:hypothetical protein BKH46_05120 [Helicobacter sp. 12S02634-8]
MSRLCWVLIFVLVSWGKEPVWSFDRNITLKKDQIYQGVVYKDTIEKPLVLRWTLYKNFGLVLYVNYDGFPHQFVLYRDYQRDMLRLELFGEGHLENASYLYVAFRDFSPKDQSAKLWIGVSGDAQFLRK